MEILDKSKQPRQEVIDIGEPSASSPNEDPSSLPNVQAHLVLRHGAKNMTIGVKLYFAALKGDWKTANHIIERQSDIVRMRITSKSETALHIAVAANHKEFVRKLLERMMPDDLALENIEGHTALSFAAALGVVEIAEILIQKNAILPRIRSGELKRPIEMAALFGHGKMVKYLHSMTNFKDIDGDDEEFIKVFHAMISADMYDVAIWILEKVESNKQLLALYQNGSGESALSLMARKPYAISHRIQQNMFQKFANSNFEGFFHEAKMRTLARRFVEELWDSVVQLSVEDVSRFLRSSRILFDAVESGNVEFLVILIRSYPDIIWTVDHDNLSLFHLAALNRHENIFNIIYELGGIKDLIASSKEAESGNNLLHLVARLPPPSRLQVVSGAALQMQRELLWFKAVKKVVPRSYIKAKNAKGEVAQDIFTKEHKTLREEGEKWMKETATACMLVATLIATVVFAAAFTVPGGNDNNTSFPNFGKEFWFDVFILSDSVALLSSVTSVVIFLSILTSRYAEDDFRTALPTKLMLGLLALFVSIISMVLAFTATMILIRDHEPKYSLVLIICLASLTALSFASLHFQLWFDALHSAYLSKFRFHQRKSGLYL